MSTPGQAYTIAEGLFVVEPKYDCPHVQILNCHPGLFAEQVPAKYYGSTCEVCGEKEENWVCLVCAHLLCSRYVQGHMKQHFMDNEEHAVSLSLLDLSLWCFICDSYVSSNEMEATLIDSFHRFKFGEPLPRRADAVSAGPSGSTQADSLQAEEIASKFETSLTLEESSTIETSNVDISKKAVGTKPEEKPTSPDVKGNRDVTVPTIDSLETLAEALRQKRFSNIVVILGAGISTAAGIPDFRSPKKGLYDNLKKYNLPHPTAVFDIEFFRKDPHPFYKVAKELMPVSVEPTLAHRFLFVLYKKGMLRRIYTQNVDNLESAAGIPKEMVVQAHGTMGQAHCIECHAEKPIEDVRKTMMNDQIPYCDNCGGLIKPDVVFFGEGLPQRFFTHSSYDMRRADLLLIIGTSLIVMPVAAMPDMVHDKVPRVLINLEPAGDIDERKNDLVLLGDCQDIVRKIMNLCDWKDEICLQKF
eukprot:jgi/Galph1/4019/GphlegSOOS_G2657.1